MPDQSSAAQPEPASVPDELNFEQPAASNPRLRRRNLKAKPAGLTKPAPVSPAARELEREAPPLKDVPAERPASPPVVADTKPANPVKVNLISKPTASVSSPAVSSASTPTPSTATPAQPRPASSSPASTPAAKPATASPHGTRPATLYYSSTTKKDATASPMKTTPVANPASASSSSAHATASAGNVRPVTPTTATRPAAANFDYRANVDRQSREQKSVGSILAYVVYALIAFFVLGTALASYGAYTINKQLHDQSTTVVELDGKYELAVKNLNSKLATQQEALTQIQALNSRQQELIAKQQEDISTLRAADLDSTVALKTERAARTQETAVLRARLREVEKANPGTTTQKL